MRGRRNRPGLAVRAAAVAAALGLLLAGGGTHGDGRGRQGPARSLCSRPGGVQIALQLRGGRSSSVQDGGFFTGVFSAEMQGVRQAGCASSASPLAASNSNMGALAVETEGATASAPPASANTERDAGVQAQGGAERHAQDGEPQEEGSGAEQHWMGLRRPWGQPGENVRMGNDEAVRRFKAGACVLVLDFPVDTDFGIDVRSWTVGPKFQGLKMVPPGMHLLHWDAGHGMTQGMWLHARPAQVLVLRWDASIEDFAPTESPGVAPEQLQRLVAAVRRHELDRGLAAYPIEDAESWCDLTRFVDGTVLAAAGLPLGPLGTSCHVVSGDPDDDAKADGETTSDMTAYFPGPARTARFSSISAMRKAALRASRDQRPEAGEERRQCSVLEGDESDTLELLLQTEMRGAPERLLGEVQLAFVSFLLLHSMSAFDYWKLAVASFCSARRLAVARPGLMHNLVSCLRVQLARAPSDWFRDELTQDSFLRNALLNLHRVHSDLREGVAHTGARAPRSSGQRASGASGGPGEAALGLGCRGLGAPGRAPSPPPAAPCPDGISAARRQGATAGSGGDGGGDESLLSFQPGAGARKGRQLLRRMAALFEFLEQHFSVRVADWSPDARQGAVGGSGFGEGFRSGLARAFAPRRQRADSAGAVGGGRRGDGGGAVEEARNSDDEAEGEGGVPVERIQVRRHMPGIDRGARLLCDDDDVAAVDSAGEEEDAGPFVEYITRELPPHRAAAAGRRRVSAGGGTEASGCGGSAMMDVGDDEMEGPQVHEEPCEQQGSGGASREVVEGGRGHGGVGEKEEEGDDDGDNRLRAVMEMLPLVRDAMDAHYSGNAPAHPGRTAPAETPGQRSRAPMIASVSAVPAAPQRGRAAAWQDVGKDVDAASETSHALPTAGHGAGASASGRRARPTGLPQDFLENPEAVKDGKNGMVLDLRESGVARLMVTGEEPGADEVAQLAARLQRPVEIERVPRDGVAPAPGEDGAPVRQGHGSGVGRARRCARNASAVVEEGAGMRVEPDGDFQRQGRRVDEAGRGAASARPPSVGTSHGIDYSRFSSLQLSDEDAGPLRRPFDMCQRCQGPRPADVEIRDENETVLEYVCKECYQRPRRMDWMCAPPEGWKDPFADGGAMDDA